MNQTTRDLSQQSAGKHHINFVVPSMRVLLASAAYCVPSKRVSALYAYGFLLPLHFYAHILSCICAFLVSSMCA